MPAKSRDHNLASAGIGHLEWLAIAHDLERVAFPQRSEVTCDDALGDLRVMLFAGGPRLRRVECPKSGSMAMRPVTPSQPARSARAPGLEFS